MKARGEEHGEERLVAPGEQQHRKAPHRSRSHSRCLAKRKMLHELFLTLWFQAKGEVWVDSEGWASLLCRGVEGGAQPRRTPTANAQARGGLGPAEPRNRSESYVSQGKAAVDAGLDPEVRPHVCGVSPQHQAVLAVRVVRSLLSYLQGSVKGLWQAGVFRLPVRPDTRKLDRPCKCAGR